MVMVIQLVPLLVILPTNSDISWSGLILGHPFVVLGCFVSSVLLGVFLQSSIIVTRGGAIARMQRVLNRFAMTCDLQVRQVAFYRVVC